MLESAILNVKLDLITSLWKKELSVSFDRDKKKLFGLLMRREKYRPEKNELFHPDIGYIWCPF